MHATVGKHQCLAVFGRHVAEIGTVGKGPGLGQCPRTVSGRRRTGRHTAQERDEHDGFSYALGQSYHELAALTHLAVNGYAAYREERACLLVLVYYALAVEQSKSMRCPAVRSRLPRGCPILIYYHLLAEQSCHLLLCHACSCV